MTDKNPYRTLHARMSPPGAAWDEGFAAGRAAATPRCDACDEPFGGQCAACRAEDDARHPQDEFDGAGCCPEEDGFLRAKARAAATPDPPDGFRVTVYSGPSDTDERPAEVSTRYAGATDLHDTLRQIGLEWKQADYMGQRQVVITVDPVAPAASPDERLREALREIVAAFPPTPDREMDEEEVDQWYADHGDWFQRLRALTAADREKPGYYDHDHAADAPPVPDPETSS